MMQQYHKIKTDFQDAILMFRLGDFYEMFGPDAETASKVLEIALTGRDAGAAGRVPMCGVPFHAAEGYIAKLIDKGFKVAICEQVEDPGLAKGIVKREVVRVISPGTIMEASLLEDKRNNYLAAVNCTELGCGLAVADISTGEFRITEVSREGFGKLINELTRLSPAEVLICPELLGNAAERIRCAVQTALVSELPASQFDPGNGVKVLTSHFGVYSLDTFGCKDLSLALGAAGGILTYLKQHGGGSLAHLSKLVPYSLSNFMLLDQATRRNLELTKTIRDQAKKGSLLDVLDLTQTAMGGRLLKQWIEQPLLDLEEVLKRQAQTEVFYLDHLLRGDIRELLKKVYDLERLLGRIVYGTANAKDLLALLNSLEVLPKVKQLLGGEQHAIAIESPLAAFTAELNPLEDLRDLLERGINPAAPFTLREGNLIKAGFNSEIDELRHAASHGKQWVAALENRERERTGIKSLKVGFNKVFGYYIEVTQANLHSVPEEFIRKQTLANAERYITPELKEYENKILGAEDKLAALEYQVFCGIREQVAARAAEIQQTARALAQLDVLACLGEVAVRNNYTKPSVNNGQVIRIIDGRHPVVEKIGSSEFFVPNDTFLDNELSRLGIITGPNMAGKSTYMRQVALIVLLAQIGSFVPATSAEIGIVDRIFTRVGASDDLSTGQSTFMVEMNEVANILHNATSKSLIILDEIGRGTATYDGLSIAWSVAEYIHRPERIGAKTLFATHYHELTELSQVLPGVCNYRVAVREKGDNIVFLRKIIQGSADKSYGIQVARLAGLPKEVITRAKEILATLESVDTAAESRREISAGAECQQLSFTLVQMPETGVDTGLFDELKSIDINQLTPLEALNILARWKKSL